VTISLISSSFSPVSHFIWPPTVTTSGMDLPKVLRDMLSAIARDNAVKTWSIYPEKQNGTICVKIRFTESTTQEAIASQPITYKAKSVKQQVRDKARFKNIPRQVATGVTTRSKSVSKSKDIINNSPIVELPRCSGPLQGGHPGISPVLLERSVSVSSTDLEPLTPPIISPVLQASMAIHERSHADLHYGWLGTTSTSTPDQHIYSSTNNINIPPDPSTLPVDIQKLPSLDDPTNPSCDNMVYEPTPSQEPVNIQPSSPEDVNTMICESTPSKQPGRELTEQERIMELLHSIQATLLIDQERLNDFSKPYATI
jgi:hypothetical protein